MEHEASLLGVSLSSPGSLLRLIREGQAASRAELALATGIARSTISQRVDALVAAGLVREAGDGPSSGGRPPVRLEFNASSGVVLAADLGATHCRLAVTDLSGDILAELAADLDIAEGPDVVLPWVLERFSELLEQAGRTDDAVRGVGIGLPGPVEFAAGRAVNPPIMPGWHGVLVPERITKRFAVPVLVDNDVNIMAVGEHWSVWRGHVEDLVFVKVGTGIGSGIITGGRIHRGAQGAAGDLGHVELAGHQEALCRCGNRGCLEAVAGGAALARQLRELGETATTSRDVVKLVHSGNQAAIVLVRDAGRLIGEVLAAVVNVFNPAVIVLGGDLSQADEQLMAGIRETVYRRSTALATHHLQIRRSQLADHAGVTGAAAMVIERILGVNEVNRFVDDHARGARDEATDTPRPVVARARSKA